MATIKITNPKIGAALILELQDEPAYQSIKAYAATHTFLRNVLHFSHDQDYANIPATKIKEWFDTHGVNYKKCLDALVRHDLIDIDRHYIVGSKTRGYRVTEKGARLVFEGQMQYLNKLFVDPDLKRKLQKQQSYHRTKADKYSKPFLQYIHDGLINYTFDQAAVTMINDSDWGYLTRLKATMSLTDFAERSFVDLKHNESDHRVWNEFVGMKSDLRKYFSLGDLKYRFVMDIRSCHPLFLGHYLVNVSKPRATPSNPNQVWGDALLKSIAERKERERSESSSYSNSTTITNLPLSKPTFTTSSRTNPISHYVGGNSDILAELARWNLLFSDPDTDPKAVLIRDLGYTRDQAKAALNQTINGSRQYRKFIMWFEARFPLLYAVWERTYKDRVGVNVSSYYETTLMQDMDLYGLAEELGLLLTYEFDGCGVMCREDDGEVLVKIQRLIENIQAKSQVLWGLRPVIVVKTAGGDVVDMCGQVQSKPSDCTKKPIVQPCKGSAGPATNAPSPASRRSAKGSSRPAPKRRWSPPPSPT
jgi:hypothetical protein